MQLLLTRRTVRRFRPDPLPREVIRRLLAVAVRAPSAHNLQPWRFVVVEDAAARERLGRALTDRMRADMTTAGASAEAIDARVARSLRRLREAPAVILFCRDVTAVRADVPEEHHMGVQSVAAAALQLLLAAHAEGLGGNWICWPLYAPAEVRAALELPSTWQPEGMLFLGYPAERPAESPRVPLEQCVHWIEE